MKLLLHEIELGSANVEGATNFFQTILGLSAAVQQLGLTVFECGVKGIDLNVSNHQQQGTTTISFLTDDLEEIESRLKTASIPFRGPSPSHLGMSCIEFKSPDGYIIKVNKPGPASPVLLKGSFPELKEQKATN